MDFNEIAGKLEKLILISKKCEGLFLNEENTKAALVLPFLQLLGYEIILDIEPEYNICTGRVDYFISKGRESIIVECKRINTNIDINEHIEQLKRYMRELEPTVGILTNGRIYNFYRYDNKQIELIFTFNIMHSNIFDIRRLWNYSKEKIEFVRELDKIQTKDYKDILQSGSLQYREVLNELEFRVLNDIFANESKLSAESIGKVMKSILGIEVARNEVVISRINQEAISRIKENTIYNIMPHIVTDTKFKIQSKDFGYNIEYRNGLASVKAGTKISSLYAYKGNVILETALRGKVRNWSLIADLNDILLSDAINIVFGTTDGIIPESIVNSVRRDNYDNDRQFIFNTICSIVGYEKIVNKTIRELSKLHNQDNG